MESEAFDARIRASWNEVREYWDCLRAGTRTRASDPQPRLASELFEVFLAESDPVVRRKALQTAFVMWGNTTSCAAVDEALDKLDPAADYWGSVLHGFSNAYSRSGRRDDILPKLHELEAKLSHPRSRSSVLLALGRHYLHTNPEAAKPFLSAVCEIAADRQSVFEAECGLYEIRTLLVGGQAPDFEATTLNGETIKLSQFRGSVVCLAFWSTTCGPCRPEMKTLRTLREEFPPAKLQVVGISSDRDADALATTIEREQLAWHHIREEVTWQDGILAFGPVRKAYNVWGIPASVVIDEFGRIAALRLRGAELVSAVRKVVSMP